MKESFVLFAGTSQPLLAEEVASCLKVKVGQALIETFPDGEIGVQILESVRGRDVFVLQSIARHPNFYLMELLILVDALKRASACSVTAVIPYFGYARQDRKVKGREPITAKLVANMLEKSGVDRVLTMDLHAEQLQGFFDIPVDNLSACPLIVEAVEKLELENLIVVTPDIGSIRLARGFADKMGVDLAIVAKRRRSDHKVDTLALIGEVKDRDVLLVDDMCSTGETLNVAFRVCREAGARRVCAAVTHGLFVGEGFEKSGIEMMLMSNTIALPQEFQSGRLQMVCVGSLFARGIECIVGKHSLSSLLFSSL